MGGWSYNDAPLENVFMEATADDAKLRRLAENILAMCEEYGFDGDPDRIQTFLEESDFPNLEYLGLTDSEIQDELAEIVLDSKYIKQIKTLDLSMGSLTDQGGALLLEKLPSYPNIEALDVHYHYMSSEMVNKLEELNRWHIAVDASEQEEAYTSSFDGEIYRMPMLTE